MVDFSGFTEIKHSDLHKIREYMEAYFIRRKYPRYYQNMMDMVYSPGKKKYYAIENGCMLIAVKAYLHKPVLYFLLPPIHRHGEVEKEIEVLKKYSGVIAFRISEEDVLMYKHFGYDVESTVNHRPEAAEFIFDSTEYTDMSGPEFRKMRYYVNQAEKQEGFQFMTFQTTSKFTLMAAAEYLYSRWIQLRGFGKHYNIFKDKSIADVNWHLTIGYHCSKPMYVSYVNMLFPERGIIVGRFGMYDKSTGIKEIKYFAHTEEMKRHPGIYNMASGYNKTLTYAKRDLLPLMELQLYDTERVVIVERDVWDAMGSSYNNENIFL